jgi:ABC transporter substrate binding protein
MPAIYSDSSFVKIGGLAFYGPDRTDLFRRSAGYVDRILRGQKPGDLPFQQPTKYELMTNRTAAKAARRRIIAGAAGARRPGDRVAAIRCTAFVASWRQAGVLQSITFMPGIARTADTNLSVRGRCVGRTAENLSLPRRPRSARPRLTWQMPLCGGCN